MSRLCNFCAGPAVLPEEVLRQAQKELLDWGGRGMSVLEASHRGAAFEQTAKNAEADLRQLLDIPSEYAVLFLQGGATGQMAAVALNLLPEGGAADYVDTGHWSKRAIAEARNFGEVRTVAALRQDEQPQCIPPPSDWQCTPGAAYLHYTPNETIGGIEFHQVPKVDSGPLAADVSSTLLSRPLDVRKFGLLYAGAQKNIGPAGLCVVIVQRALLGRARGTTPSVLNYTLQAEKSSMLNTPPTFAWYMAGLNFRWLLEQGGLAAMAVRNQSKAERLYAVIDGSDFYHNPVAPECRSWMNVPFTLAEPSLDRDFLSDAEKAGLLSLKGHRSVGGMRASLYNALPETAVDALINFMRDFEKCRT